MKTTNQEPKCLFYFDLLVKCQKPQTVHLYACISCPSLFSLIYLITSSASSNELYIGFLQGGSSG